MTGGVTGTLISLVVQPTHWLVGVRTITLARSLNRHVNLNVIADSSASIIVSLSVDSTDRSVFVKTLTFLHALSLYVVPVQVADGVALVHVGDASFAADWSPSFAAGLAKEGTANGHRGDHRHWTDSGHGDGLFAIVSPVRGRARC